MQSIRLNGEVTPNPQWRNAMDDHDQLEYATASGNDYPSHEQMYRTFVTLTKSFVAVIAVIVILMAIFLT
jgi:aa3 type cytochrome c oxidase subunit IV